MLLILLGVTILVLSLTPRAIRLPHEFRFEDKLEHLISYIALGACMMLAVNRRGVLPCLIVIALCSAYGGAIEIVQPLVGRTRDIWDFMADLSGAAFGAIIIVLLRAGQRRRGEGGSPPRGDAKPSG